LQILFRRLDGKSAQTVVASQLQYQDVDRTSKKPIHAAQTTGAGIAEERVCVDPGIGFGKTVEHNLELIRRLDEIVAIGRPVVIGTSRKSFLGKLTGRDVGDRLPGTIATNVLALERGASVFRVHDVAQNADALAVAAATFRLNVGEGAR